MTFSLFDLAFVGSLTAAAYDPDAQSYITAVEAADGQALEVGVRDAYNDFFVGCKADGNFNALKAACIMIGARTLAGALVPLVGTAPTNNNFVAGDYDRETGLVGDGSTKYLDSNRADNADPQNDAHAFVHVITADTRFNTGSAGSYIGSANAGFASRRSIGPYFNSLYLSNRSGAASSGAGSLTGGMGTSRSSSTGYDILKDNTLTTRTVSSVSPGSQTILIFADNANGTVQTRSDARIAFYSIGESLDLDLLRARVTALIAAIGAAIP